MQGIFITFEGPDGCGKTTQAARVAAALEAAGREVVRLRDPGGTSISEQVRAVLLDPSNAEMCPDCELLLYEASRAQLTRQVIEPALAAGKVVVCDRYYDSTYAYQMGGHGLSEATVRQANVLGSCGHVPDVTVLLDIAAEEAFARAGRVEDGGPDRLESEGLGLQRRVREAYLRLAETEPKRIRVVDAMGTPDEVAARVAAVLADVLAEATQAAGEGSGAAEEFFTSQGDGNAR